MQLARRIEFRLAEGALIHIIFFVLYFLFLWQAVDLRLIYHNSRSDACFSVFYIGWDFFLKFVSYPGGPIEYLASFLSQFFCIGWAGALVATAAAWLVCVCSRLIEKTLNTVYLWWVHFVPPIIFLVLYAMYIHHLVITLTLLAALACVYLYLRMGNKSQRYRLTGFIIVSIVLYYAAGGAFLLFAALCAIYELFQGRLLPTVLYLLSAAAIPYIEGVLVFGTSVMDAFSNLTPFSWKLLFYGFPAQLLILLYILYLYLPVTALSLKLRGKLTERAAGQSVAVETSKAGTNCANQKAEKGKRRGILSLVIDSGLLFVVIVFAFFYSYNRQFKPFLSLGYNSYYKNWPKVLSAARLCADSNIAAYEANRALFHTGRLGYDMFSYPQHPDALMLTSEKYKPAHWARFDTNIELGQINLAEDDLIKGVEAYGERPAMLKRLALINMVKQNMGAARTYLGALSRTLFDAGWANNYLNRLESDPNLSSDKEVQHLRQLRVTEDLVFKDPSFVSEKILMSPLIKNRQNRMAFEYLMAYYLLTMQPDKLVQNLDRLNYFGYPDIPRHYEEAILIYTYDTKKPVDLYGRRISQETYERFRGFEQVLSRNSGNKDMAFNELSKDYGDSYMFYYLYGRSGVKKK
jgi:hypothetical protein